MRFAWKIVGIIPIIGKLLAENVRLVYRHWLCIFSFASLAFSVHRLSTAHAIATAAGDAYMSNVIACMDSAENVHCEIDANKLQILSETWNISPNGKEQNVCVCVCDSFLVKYRMTLVTHRSNSGIEVFKALAQIQLNIPDEFNVLY